MLPAVNRMRNGRDFTAAVRGGRRAGRRTVVVHLNARPAVPTGATAPDGSTTQVGFVVSKAVGPAVVRNRVKRRLRHIVRDRLTLLPADSLIVVRANPAAAGADSAAVLAADFDSALSSLLRDRRGDPRGTTARRSEPGARS